MSCLPRCPYFRGVLNINEVPLISGTELTNQHTKEMTDLFWWVFSELCCWLQLTVQLVGEGDQLQVHWREAAIVTSPLCKPGDYRYNIYMCFNI